MRWGIVLLGCVSVLRPVSAQDPADVARLVDHPSIRSALAAIQTSEPATIAEQIRLCEIPAPPFKDASTARATSSANVPGARRARTW
jgi:hypothetical protein